MSTDSKNIQRLTKIENEMMRSRQPPLAAKKHCFENQDKLNFDFESKNNINGLQSTSSSCADEIFMKTQIGKYAKRLMDKLQKISVNVPDNGEHAAAVAQLCRKTQRLLKDLNQVGGPCDSSTVLLKKYNCLRMTYYDLRDGINGTTKKLCNEGMPMVVQQSKNREKCKKIEICKKLNNNGKQDNCKSRDKQDKCINKLQIENFTKICQNGETIENLRKRELCEYCGKRKKLCGMTWEPKSRSEKSNCRRKPIEWKTFLKNQLFIYFPCLCCMFGKSD
ncbi:uncharacterized protein LOC114126211 [Aphis gossypii]|uniref:Uncharacterized protein n=1 Tax=Aphis gossypii TaxID=80765 RepID=A0A9P0NNX1_APHGO|nr:uncharacterized protein LOC114126211 [Aphis gossypii]CAH1730890.1 unnamed protein product [Aphis gossypii]